MVLNGDVLADLDLSALASFHADRDAVATLALYPVEDPSSYGLVRRDENGAVLGFLEKPEPAEIDTDEVNAGAYVLERAMVGLIPAGRAVSIEREVFPRLVGQGLFGLRLDGYWMDIGTPERYLQASWDILERRVETDVEVNGSGVLIAPDASVDSSAVVGPRAIVAGAGRVGPDAVIDSSVLLRGCSVGSGAQIREAILAPGVDVGAGARIGAGAVVGEGARIAAGAQVEPGARIDPATEVGA